MSGKRIINVAGKILAFFIVLTITASALPLGAFAKTLADVEKDKYYKNGPSPMDCTPENVTATKGKAGIDESPNYSLLLDGVWKMTDSGSVSELAAGKGWEKAIDANVPGSIYTALYEAGVIPDPYMGDNMKTANSQSEKNWYLRRDFTYEGGGKRVELAFEGLCNVADIYLNGVKIASHEGMFGGPYVDVTNTVKKGSNTLVVRLYPAKDYTKTVVFNSSYGWHYAKLYPLGIWQSVSVKDLPSVTLDHPFITTIDYKKGTVDLAIQIDDASAGKSAGGVEGTLTVEFAPKNFKGTVSHFTKTVKTSDASTLLRFRTDIPDAKLWWPAGYGEQNLYDLKVSFTAKDGSTHYTVSEFGIRELAYEPVGGRERANTYNRQFVVNGVKVYMKGAGWCTSDAMMRFTREDYDRILSRAKDAGINFLRSWGGGLVETEEFYDLCDEYGIMVYQEWPCCWDSTKTQPANVLYETVIYGAKRLRNRPSLAVWGGGNEGEAPYSDKVMNNMGKLTYENDGTRDFWRQDGGIAADGIRHDHIWWSGHTPEYYISTYTPISNLNMHEYGLGAMMNLSSIEKFATKEELAEWPLGKDSSIAYHTATFNGYTNWTTTPYGYDIDTHMHYAGLFTDAANLRELIIGSQLSQAQADYPLAINQRIKADKNSANVIYKLNDNYPGASWSIVDWYGAPKISYYLMQDAYRPVMAAFMADHYNTYDSDGNSGELELPVYILDDAVTLKGKKTSVVMRAFDGELKTVKSETFSGKTGESVNSVGTFTLSAEETAHTPLIITADLMVDGKLCDRTYMFFNYESEPGCLFYMPRTDLEYSVSGKTVTLKNTGDVPAVAVSLLTGDEAKFVCSDNYFILLPGESCEVTVNDPALFTGVTSFNPGNSSDKTAPGAPENVKAEAVSSSEVKVSWTPSEDESGIFAYNIVLKRGEETSETAVHGGLSEFVVTGLEEDTEYTVTVTAVDNAGNVSKESRSVSFTTAADDTRPEAVYAYGKEDGSVIVKFSREMERTSAENTDHYLVDRGAAVKNAKLSADGTEVCLTLDGYKEGVPYILCIAGVTDTKKNRNLVPYTRINVMQGLYLSADFEPDGEGLSRTGGSVAKTVEGIGVEPIYDAEGISGSALLSANGRGVKIDDIGFTLKEGTSVSFWIKGKASAEGYNVLLAKGPKESGHFEFYTKNGALYFYAPDVGDLSLKYNVNSGSSDWRQLAFVADEGRLNIYENGVLVSSVSFKKTIRETVDTISFGALNDGTLSFAGSIDAVRFYERAVTPEELDLERSLMIRPMHPEAKGDETGTSGKTSFSLKTGQTLELWFYADSVADDYGILFAKGTKDTNGHFEIYTDRGQLALYAPGMSGSAVILFGVDARELTGGWHMLTLAHDDNLLVLYIDGVKTGTFPGGFALDEKEDTYYVGRLVEGGFDFPGKIAELRLADSLMSDSEIKAEYEKHLKEDPPPGEEYVTFENHIIWLRPGESMPLGLKAREGAEYELSLAGSSVTLDGDVIKAMSFGDTVISARSDDGEYVSAVLVRVYDPKVTTPDPRDAFIPGNDSGDNGPAKWIIIVAVCVLAAAAIAGSVAIAAVVVSRKKKNSEKSGGEAEGPEK
ncbi:MAG: fibronectin type III domain-containing protein [Clostridia bacterium]|nr:fibronectin type III domain-containing protein [Clostridia bacterium]